MGNATSVNAKAKGANPAAAAPLVSLEDADRAFTAIDTDKSGGLSGEELRVAAAAAGARSMPPARLEWLMQQYDANGDGQLDRGEFSKVVKHFKDGQLVCNELAHAWEEISSLRKQMLELKAAAARCLQERGNSG